MPSAQQGRYLRYKVHRWWSFRTCIAAGTADDAPFLPLAPDVLLLQVRQAAEVHRQVRCYVHTIAKPGILMSDLCEKLEDSGGWVDVVDVVGVVGAAVRETGGLRWVGDSCR